MLKNNTRFTKQELIAIFGEDNCLNLEGIVEIEGISTDTRELEEGNLFVALKGETFDANEHHSQAFEAGAFAAVINREYYFRNLNEFTDKPLILVKNTLSALGELAKHHRRRFDIPVFVVGGSNGKTTTKDMIAHVVASKYKILKTESNYNNQVGVPLTLLCLNESHELAVIECGTNEPGEIAILSSLVEPTHGLITNIGREHLEKLIDLDGVEMEETFLFGYLKKNGGICLVNDDDNRLTKYASFLDKRFTYGNMPDSDLKADLEINRGLNPIVHFHYSGENYSVELQTTGYASGLNAIAAIAAGIVLGIDVYSIINSLESFSQDTSHEYARMVLQKINGITVLNDCYNANPESMRMSLKTLEALSSNKKYAVLGDMREMGDSSESEHLLLLKENLSLADAFFVTGQEMCKAAETLNEKKIKSYADKDTLVSDLMQEVQEGDAFLLKGSRGMKMETILASINN